MIEFVIEHLAGFLEVGLGFVVGMPLGMLLTIHKFKKIEKNRLHNRHTYRLLDILRDSYNISVLAGIIGTAPNSATPNEAQPIGKPSITTC